jgi:adenylate kinase
VKARSPLGLQVESTLATGGLVSDSLMTDLVTERLSRPDAARGFILDGFPRTITQAEVLTRLLGGRSPVVAQIVAANDEIVRRLGRRRICASCSITQSVSVDDEALTDPCPYCGGRLVRRPDDAPETVLRRLTTFEAFATPVIEHYRSTPRFGQVDGLQSPDAVTDALTRLIERAATAEG